MILSVAPLARTWCHRTELDADDWLLALATVSLQRSTTLGRRSRSRTEPKGGKETMNDTIDVRTGRDRDRRRRRHRAGDSVAAYRRRDADRDCVVFLASQASDDVHGQVLAVDGGRLAR